MREVAALAPFRGPHSNTWTVQAGSSAAAETRPAPRPQARPRLLRSSSQGLGWRGRLASHPWRHTCLALGTRFWHSPLPPTHHTNTNLSHCSMLASWRMGTNHHSDSRHRFITSRFCRAQRCEMGPRRCVLPGGPRSSWGSWGASAPCVCQPRRWLHSLAHGIAIAQALLPASVLTSPLPLALLPPSCNDLQMTLGHLGEPEELPIPRSLTSSHLPSPFCM